MCALCGSLGGKAHWTDAAARDGDDAQSADPMRRRRERAARVRLVNRVLAVYGMKLSDWQGAAFLLQTFTGKAEIIEDLGHLWPAAEKLSGRLCDPLAPELLARLGQTDG